MILRMLRGKGMSRSLSAGKRLAYVTIPKATTAARIAEVIDAIQLRTRAAGRSTPLPVHVLIETHGAVDASALRSPGQFDHA